MNQEKFVLLMQMTLSDNDGECLNAIRMANKMLVAEKLNWEQYLAGRPQAAPEQPKQRAAPGRPPGWFNSRNGNWVKKLKDGTLVTVFAKRDRSGYTWVNDGVFGPTFEDWQEAVDDADEIFG